ncbi:MAG: relaxase/mobilization nuclease domain-containing protein [Clostridia bacterium]|nr:relaxase/mobilization nuclease domain-containing protein [Clostridia bacterium]
MNLVATFGCDKNIVASEFALSQAQYYSKTGRIPKNSVLAYQIRQSFKPGEISAEEANLIGYELAERYLKGKFAFVVATHIDKAHIHNHIYFNSVSLDCCHKHRDRKYSAKNIARLSDLICIEHQLSTIANPQHRNTSYAKWEGYTPYLSHRDLLRNDIDEVISMMPKDFDAFLSFMKERDYEIKVGKHIAFKKKEQKKFIRLGSLGEGYSEDDIRLSIAEKRTRTSKTKQNEKTSLLIDVQKKIDEGKGQGYANWAKVFNLKQMAKTVMFLQENDFESLEKLSSDIDALSSEISEMKTAIKNLETRLTELSTLKTQIINYTKTREVFEQYKASGYSKTFLTEHEGEIILHRAAKKAFDELGVKKLPSVKSINKEFEEVLKKKKSFYPQYHSSNEKYREMLKHKANIQSILGVTVSEKEQEQSH